MTHFSDPVITNEPFKNQRLSKKCSYCGIVFKSFAGVNTHMKRIHLKISNYFCDICGKGTFLKSVMGHHMKKHIDVKSRRRLCCLHCSKDFISIQGRNSHLEIAHQDKKIHECFCGDDFKSADELRNHLLKVHNQSDEIGKNQTQTYHY